ncbi:hypothetical protein [Cupriavidus sp. SK-4]|uniref:hypothetical protein n=1 Tax=Cupriavidus sp. SK-4 TaxID=574750 RepID=UPI001268AAA6|nr:hypothetical protein [Cupriavidus sp. SK-4]
MWPRYRRMLERCGNPRHPAYGNYGGRGIQVCEEWRNDFWAFAEFWGDIPFPDASMERLDVNGNYEPGNCKWATPKEQARNKRNTRSVTLDDGRAVSLAEVAEDNGLSWATLKDRVTRSGRSLADALDLPHWTQMRTAVEIDGERRSMAAWARHYGIPYDVFRDRIKRGMDPKDVVGLPPGCHVRTLVAYQGERLPLKEWAARFGMRYSTLYGRLRAGWPVERALTTPTMQAA